MGATNGNHYPEGGLTINGSPAWPDQNLMFVAYGASEPTRSELQSIWQLMTSDWRSGAPVVQRFPRYLLRSGFRGRRRSAWNVVGYTLRCQRNRVLYIGITNNPRAREVEHRLDGKRFDHLSVETRPMSRDYAEAWEARRLAKHRDYVGRNPHYNRTDDGQYHDGQRSLRDPSADTRKTPRPRQRDYGNGVSGVGWFVVLLVLLVGVILVFEMVSGPAG